MSAARTESGMVALLLALAATSWWSTLGRMQGMDAGPWTRLGPLAGFLGIWVVMMAAMMLPRALGGRSDARARWALPAHATEGRVPFEMPVASRLPPRLPASRPDRRAADGRGARLVVRRLLLGAEKILPWRRIATGTTTELLVVLGLFLLVAPGVVPGLALPGGGPMPMGG